MASFEAFSSNLPEVCEYDHAKMFAKIENLCMAQMRQFLPPLTLIAVLDKVQPVLVGVNSIEEIYRLCILDRATPQALTKIKRDYSADKVEARFIWEVVSDLYFEERKRQSAYLADRGRMLRGESERKVRPKPEMLG